MCPLEGMCPLDFCFLLLKTMSIVEADVGEWSEGQKKCLFHSEIWKLLFK